MQIALPFPGGVFYNRIFVLLTAGQLMLSCPPQPHPWPKASPEACVWLSPFELAFCVAGQPRCWQEQNDLFLRVKIQTMIEMTHTGSRRETLTSDLPPSVHRESRCYSNHITNSERWGLLHTTSGSMPLIGAGTWKASSPKFLSPQVLLAPMGVTAPQKAV